MGLIANRIEIANALVRIPRVNADDKALSQKFESGSDGEMRLPSKDPNLYADLRFDLKN